MAAPVGDTCASLLTESVVSAFVFSSGAAPGGREAKWLLPETLAIARDHGLFASAEGGASVNRVISHCNLCLNSVKTRWDGLSLLAALVHDCSTQVFLQHCCAWLRSVTKLLQPYEPEGGLALAVRVLSDLLRFSAQLPELAREVAQSHLPALMSALLALREQRECVAMEGLLACMRFFPRTSSTAKVKLEQLFVPRLVSAVPAVRELALSGFVLLPCLGGGEQKHAEAWTQQLHDLLHSLHAALARLYSAHAGLEETQERGPGVQLLVPQPAADSPLFLLHVKQEFSWLARALIAMLREEFAVPVKVPVERILGLVCQVLAISPKRLAVGGEASVQLLVLPAVHTDALWLLEALVSTCGKRLLRFGDVINRAFPQVLATWGSAPAEREGPAARGSPYSEVRVRAYRALAAWVDACGVASLVLQEELQHAHILLAHLVRDAGPTAASDVIRVGRASGGLQPGGRAAKRHKGGGGGASVASAGTAPGAGAAGPGKSDAQAGAELCLAALHALARAVVRCGSQLPPKVHERLHELAVGSLLALQAGGAAPRPLGASPACRTALYRLLLHLVLAPSPALPPPLQPALRILARGQQDENPQVSLFCADALAIVSAIIHPRVPSLQLPAATVAAVPAEPAKAAAAAAHDFPWNAWTPGPPADLDAGTCDGRPDGGPPQGVDPAPFPAGPSEATGSTALASPGDDGGGDGGGDDGGGGGGGGNKLGGTGDGDGSDAPGNGGDDSDDSVAVEASVAVAPPPRRGDPDEEGGGERATAPARCSPGAEGRGDPDEEGGDEDGRGGERSGGRGTKRKRRRVEQRAGATADEDDGGTADDDDGGDGGKEDEEAMMSMLADFVDCPPESGASCCDVDAPV